MRRRKKQTLIFLHGMGGDLTAWNSVRKYFRNLDHPTLALDLRGFGLSPRPKDEQSYQLKNFVENVVVANLIKEFLDKIV